MKPNETSIDPPLLMAKRVTLSRHFMMHAVPPLYLARKMAEYLSDTDSCHSSLQLSVVFFFHH
jgi:hypothetical protein